MSNILTKLRAGGSVSSEVAEEAANKIELLRNALKPFANYVAIVDNTLPELKNQAVYLEYCAARDAIADIVDPLEDIEQPELVAKTA